MVSLYGIVGFKFFGLHRDNLMGEQIQSKR
jgi:hypothetical protein